MHASLVLNGANLLTEELDKTGHQITLFARGDSHTSAILSAVTDRPSPPRRHLRRAPYPIKEVERVRQRTCDFAIIHGATIYHGLAADQYDFVCPKAAPPLIRRIVTRRQLRVTLHMRDVIRRPDVARHNRRMNKQCVLCRRTSDTVPLLTLEYRRATFRVCSQHLPVLIHDPAQMIGLIEGAEEFRPSEHRD
jgi:hypothetical protein